MFIAILCIIIQKLFTQVVQVYVEWTNTSLPTPNRQLVAFDRVSTTTDDVTEVTLTFPTETLNVWDDNDDVFVLLTGNVQVYLKILKSMTTDN